jgi:hypothetical protein
MFQNILKNNYADWQLNHVVDSLLIPNLFEAGLFKSHEYYCQGDDQHSLVLYILYSPYDRHWQLQSVWLQTKKMEERWETARMSLPSQLEHTPQLSS